MCISLDASIPCYLGRVSHPYLNITLFLQTSNSQGNGGFSVLQTELVFEKELNPGFSKSELDAVPPVMVGRANIIHSARLERQGRVVLFI